MVVNKQISTIGILGAIAVALGAFGAHTLKNQLPSDGVLIKLAMELPQKPQKPAVTTTTNPPAPNGMWHIREPARPGWTATTRTPPPTASARNVTAMSHRW